MTTGGVHRLPETRAVIEALTAIRQARRMSRADLANLMGTHQSWVSEVETGVRADPHPLCTCSESTFTFHPDRTACRARAFPIDPHPVLEIEDIRAIRSIVADLYPRGSRSSER